VVVGRPGTAESGAHGVTALLVPTDLPGLMEQQLRDVLGFQIGDGTAQIMKTVIARARAGRAAVPS
jgi:alkylation response protein AidB-like acyl-CoA dehydrogenase